MPKGSASVGARSAWSFAISVGLPGRIAGAQSAARTRAPTRHEPGQGDAPRPGRPPAQRPARHRRLTRGSMTPYRMSVARLTSMNIAPMTSSVPCTTG